MNYLNWNTKIITDFSPANVEAMYDAGYVFTRVDKGVMNQTRSFRIKLSDFEMSSENRRILRKSENLKLEVCQIPYDDYTWEVGKLAKDFYDSLGADFSANKVKELLTDPSKSNFNLLLSYSEKVEPFLGKGSTFSLGYCIVYESDKIFHYCYPFYKNDPAEPSRGLGMMMQAINYAKEKGLEYIYLGSLQRPTDTYKLQFSGQEWFDGKGWQTDLTPLKAILK